MGAAKILAKNLIKIRQSREKLYNMKAQLKWVQFVHSETNPLKSGVSTQVTTMNAQANMTKTLGQTSRIMESANKMAPLPVMQKTMMEYAKQNEMAEMKQEYTFF